jgi:hypothetical protein
MAKKKPETITINKKVMLGVAPAIAIIAILLSKNQPGPLLLFLIGIAAGIIIGVNYQKV